MWRELIAPLLIGIAGTGVLIGLGSWQVQRLAWKEGLIAELEARLSAAPVALPEAPAEARDEYLRVAVDGRYLEGELHVLTSAKPWGPDFRVVAPYETTNGRRILVDRGYVPEEQKGAPRDAPAGPVAGALLWPDETDAFTPDPDLGRNFWFARDVAPMAAALGTAPVLVVAETNPGDWPKARPLTVNLPNDHLQYAITWFGLALVWAAMTVFWSVRILRGGARESA